MNGRTPLGVLVLVEGYGRNKFSLISRFRASRWKNDEHQRFLHLLVSGNVVGVGCNWVILAADGSDALWPYTRNYRSDRQTKAKGLRAHVQFPCFPPSEFGGGGQFGVFTFSRSECCNLCQTDWNRNFLVKDRVPFICNSYTLCLTADNTHSALDTFHSKIKVFLLLSPTKALYFVWLIFGVGV